MKFLLLACSLFLAAIAASVSAQERLVAADGYHWQSLSHGTKLGYAMGLVDASRILRYFSQEIKEEQKLSARSRIYLEGLKEQLNKWNFDNVSFGQVVEGLDRQYKDYRLLKEQIGDVLAIVRLELSGATAEEIENQKRRLLTSPQDPNRTRQ